MSQIQASKDNVYINQPTGYTNNYATQGATNNSNIITGAANSYYYQQPNASYENPSNAPAGYTTSDTSKYQTTRTGYTNTGYATTGATGYAPTGASVYTATSTSAGQKAVVADIPV